MAETRKTTRTGKTKAARKAPAASSKAALAKGRGAGAKDSARQGARRAEPKGGARRERGGDGGFDVAKLIEHPLVADLLAVGAMAAVAAIADHNVKSRTGELDEQSSGAVKAAGKAAAAAIGRRLMSEVNAVRKASKPAGD